MKHKLKPTIIETNVKAEFLFGNRQTLPSASPSVLASILGDKMKQCTKCKTIKPLSEFSLDSRLKNKLCASCKKCQAIYRAIFCKRMKEKFNGLYDVWQKLKQRCFDPKDEAYKYYGGRGITVCEEWRGNFHTFYEWAKNKHREGLTIDRVNNDGNYEPSNCRFTTRKENMRNCSATKLNIKQVKEIKKLLQDNKLSQRKIGLMFKVDNTAISKIKIGKTWADVN